MADLEAALAEAASALAAAGTIVAVGHVNPDGDALGASLGLALAASGAGKTSWATFGEPLTISNDFRYLVLDAVVSPAEIPGEIDVLVACDTANRERLGTAAALADRAGTVVVVDHHLSNGGFGDVAVVDPGAAATVQLMYRLIVEHLGWPLTEPVATALYTGLVTDTGRFQYSATTPEVHRVAGELLRAGADPDRISRHLYGEAPFGYLKVAGAVLSRAVLVPASRMVWSVMYRDDLDAAGVGAEETDGLIDLLRLAEEAEVACLLKEVEPGTFKGSLRSRGSVDVNAVASAFGGGGHHNASGFTAVGQPDRIAATVAESLA